MSSGLSSADVYVGFWINWSEGRVLGSNLTVTVQNGAFLVAFLALFVQLVGSHLWDIISFICHQYRATPQPRDGVHWQQQAIFRNSSTPSTALWDLLKISWAWRSLAKRPYSRTLPFAALTSLYAVSLTLAGIFSSQLITTSGIEVLVQSPSCGYWQPSGLNGSEAAVDDPVNVAQLSYYYGQIDTSSIYSRACYDKGTDLPQCNVFSKQQIDWTSDHNATCPFAPGTCIGTNTAALQLDTGHMDSHNTFGINAPKENRVTYRKVTTCAPITTDGYLFWVNASDSVDLRQTLPGERFAEFRYGNSAPNPYVNFTWRVSSYGIWETRAYTLFAMDYFLGSEETSSWNPAPEFYRDNADAVIFFLQGNIVLAAHPTDDPFFSAHVPYVQPGYYGNETFYLFDNPANVLACTEQHQFCNPNLPQQTGCTPLTGIYPAGNASRNIGANTRQLSTIDLIHRTITQWTASIELISEESPPKLVAQESVLGGNFQLPLPNNQWAIEVEDWHGTVMALIQNLIVGHATGPINPAYRKYIVPPNNTEEQQLCHAQKIRSNGSHVSINVFGLAFTLAIGGLIICANLVHGVGIGWSLQRRGKLSYRRLEWINDEKLQLQRLAYERSGIGPWNVSSLVPTIATAAAGDVLEPLSALAGELSSSTPSSAIRVSEKPLSNSSPPPALDPTPDSVGPVDEEQPLRVFPATALPDESVTNSPASTENEEHTPSRREIGQSPASQPSQESRGMPTTALDSSTAPDAESTRASHPGEPDNTQTP